MMGQFPHLASRSLHLRSSFGCNSTALIGLNLTHLTHPFSVCGTQPIFGAIDTNAARRLSCCPAPSKTIRMARLRTFVEYLCAVLFRVLHPTQTPCVAARPSCFAAP